MNCQEALAHLYEVIDKEIADIDYDEVKRHLARCGHCHDRYKLEGALDEFLKERVRTVSRVAAGDRLKALIIAKLDECDAAARSPQREGGAGKSIRHPFRSVGVVFASAAALVVFIGAGYLISQLSYHQRTYIPLERLHWAAERNQAEFAYAQFATASAETEDRIRYQMHEHVGDFSLLGVKRDTLDGVPMHHFVYSNDKKQLVSVFVTTANSVVLPDDLKSTAVVRAGKTFFDHNCRGCRVVYHINGDALVITATSDHTIDLLDFVPGQSRI